MEMKINLPAVQYGQIKPGQLFTDKFCQNLYCMTQNKDNESFKLGSNNFYECIKISNEGISPTGSRQLVGPFEIELLYDPINPFEFSPCTNSLKQIFIDDLYFIVSSIGVIKEINR